MEVMFIVLAGIAGWLRRKIAEPKEAMRAYQWTIAQRDHPSSWPSTIRH